MSIIPGIETAAPERTDTSSGSFVSPKRLPVFGSSAREVLVDLRLEPVRQRLAVRHVRAAGVGRDREARRNRDAHLRHLGEADRPCRRAAHGLPRKARRSRRRSAGARRESSHKCPAILGVVPEPTIVAMGGVPDETLLDYVLGPRTGKAPALRTRPPAWRTPDRTVWWYERLRGRAEMTHLHFFPWPPCGPPGAGARPRRDRRHRREHGERARDLAHARLRRDPARSLGAGRPVDRLERRNDLLVRARRHRLVRSRARADGVPRLAAGERLPALRRRGAAPSRLHTTRRGADCRPASPPTTTSRFTTSAPSFVRS